MKILFKSNSKIFYINEYNNLSSEPIVSFDNIDISNIPYVLDQPLLYHAHYITKLEVYYQHNGYALCYVRNLKTYHILDVNTFDKIDYTQANINNLKNGNII